MRSLLITVKSRISIFILQTVRADGFLGFVRGEVCRGEEGAWQGVGFFLLLFLFYIV